MAYGDFKELPGRTTSDKYYVIKYLLLQKILNMMNINVDLLHWFINILIK